MPFFHRTAAILAVAVACTAVAGAAAGSTMTLGAAVRATLDHNPQLAGYAFKVNALAGEKQTAALRPELRVNSDFENLAGSGNFSGVNAGELTISLSSALELGGQRDARIDVVSARQQQLASSQRVLTLDLVAAVTRQFIRVLVAQDEWVLQRESHQLMQQTLNSLTRQVQAGGTAQGELLRAKAALARAAVALQQARQRVTGERRKLSGFWAHSSPDFSEVKGDLYRVPAAVTLPTLLTKLSSNPDLALLSAATAVRSAEVRRVASERRANLEWSAGVRRFEATDDSAVVVGVSMPLGASTRAHGAIATATANQQQAEVEQGAARIQLEAVLIDTFETHQQAVDEVHALRDQVLPWLKQAMRSTADAFDQGRYSYLELNLAQRQLLEAQQALVEAAARMQETRIELERLIGSSLDEQNLEVSP